MVVFKLGGYIDTLCNIKRIRIYNLFINMKYFIIIGFILALFPIWDIILVVLFVLISEMIDFFKFIFNSINKFIKYIIKNISKLKKKNRMLMIIDPYGEEIWNG